MFESLLSLLLASSVNFSPALPENTQAFDDRLLLEVAPLPVQNERFIEPPNMSAGAVMAIDLETLDVLYEHNSHARVPVASINKLMTATVITSEQNFDEIVTVSPNAASAIGSGMGLYAGEQITVRNLLYGLLIESANDGAIALAEHNAGTVPAFVEKMNQKADELGLSNTRYNNPTGLDSSLAYSSARDVATLSAHLIQNPDIRSIVKHESMEVSSIDGHTHHLVSTNTLLGELGVQGLKTGKTPEALENFSSYAITPSGDEIITVVLNSENRFKDTRILLDWIYRAFSW